MEFYRKHPGQPGRGHRFMRTCRVEMHMDISQAQEPFCVEMYKPNATDTTSIDHRALTVTARTPQCGHTVWGTTHPTLGVYISNVYIYIYILII